MSGTAGDTAMAYLDLHHDAPVAMSWLYHLRSRPGEAGVHG